MELESKNKHGGGHFDFRAPAVFVMMMIFFAKMCMLELDHVDEPLFLVRQQTQCHTTESLVINNFFSSKQISKIEQACRTSKGKTTLLYLCTLLVMQSADTELNPGPRGRPPKYPCGSCNLAVRWNDDRGGVFCENCEVWFHASCEGMSKHIYDIIGNCNISWICTNCAMPNFSSTIFELSTYEENRFQSLSDSDLNSPKTPDNIGPPQASSSPNTRPPHRAKVTKPL